MVQANCSSKSDPQNLSTEGVAVSRTITWLNSWPREETELESELETVLPSSVLTLRAAFLLFIEIGCSKRYPESLN